MFSLFVPLLINLRTTYHRPQFPPVKKEKRHQKQNLQKKRIDCMRRSIYDTSSQAFERNSQSIRVSHHNT